MTEGRKGKSRTFLEKEGRNPWEVLKRQRRIRKRE
jgi:hypothetical protein